jgi:uncharacterized protein
MDRDEKIQFASLFLRALTKGDTDALESMVTEDFEVWIIGRLPLSGTHSKESLFRLIEGGKLWSEPVLFKFQGVTIEGDRIAIEAEGVGRANTGKPYQNFFHFLFELRDGRVARLREYTDTLPVIEAFAS